MGCGVHYRLDDDVNGSVILGVERKDEDKEVSSETKVSFCSSLLVRPGVKRVYRVVILMPFSKLEISGKQRGRRGELHPMTGDSEHAKEAGIKLGLGDIWHIGS